MTCARNALPGNPRQLAPPVLDSKLPQTLADLRGRAVGAAFIGAPDTVLWPARLVSRRYPPGAELPIRSRSAAVPGATVDPRGHLPPWLRGSAPVVTRWVVRPMAGETMSPTPRDATVTRARSATGGSPVQARVSLSRGGRRATPPSDPPKGLKRLARPPRLTETLLAHSSQRHGQFGPHGGLNLDPCRNAAVDAPAPSSLRARTHARSARQR